jgi:hypothetical protein
MTLANLARLLTLSLLAYLVGGTCWLACAATRGENQPGPAGRRYGPTAPSGHFVRVTPSSLAISHTQRPSFTVTVEDAAGQPTDDVLVRFAPSEGTMTTGTSRTRGGTVTGTFTVATGSDSPRTAFVIVTVEDVEVTVFIDIVPAVVGR